MCRDEAGLLEPANGPRHVKGARGRLALRRPRTQQLLHLRAKHGPVRLDELGNGVVARPAVSPGPLEVDVAAQPALRRQGRRHRVPGTGQVVLGDPQRQPHDIRRQERLIVEHLVHVTQPCMRHVSIGRVGIGDDAGHLARTDGDDDPGTGFDGLALGQPIGQHPQSGDGNRHADEGHYAPSRSSAMTFLRSSQASRFLSGLRSR